MNRVFLLEKSTRPAKKFQVTDLKTGKKVYFGSSEYSDYTLHRDIERQKRYINRHRARENWKRSGLGTAGFWSRWILWNKPGLIPSIRDTERRFNIKIKNSSGQRGGGRTVTDLSDLELATIFEQLSIKDIRNFLIAVPEIKELLKPPVRSTSEDEGDGVKPMDLSRKVYWKKVLDDSGFAPLYVLSRYKGGNPIFTALYKTIEKRSPTLSLRYSDLQRLPPEIGELDFLLSLDLSINNLVTLPEEIGKLTLLRGLNLSSNNLRRLPDTIGDLTNLERLDVSNNKNLKTLPRTISRLSNLKSINIKDTSIDPKNVQTSAKILA